MIYMVEMALLDLARRAEWDAWYAAHQHRLLTIPGFRASQRFEAIHVAESPFVALHEVDSPEIFARQTYRAQAGPSNTGEWQTKMGHWHRNLFGVDHTPDVPMDTRLVVVEDDGGSALPDHVQRRALVVMPPTAADRLIGTRGVRVLRPIGPRFTHAR